MENIVVINRKKEQSSIIQEETEIHDFTACDLKTTQKNKKGEKLPGSSIVSKIDSIYDVRSDSPTLTRRDISQYIRSLPEYIKLECIEKYYLERFDKAVSNEDANMVIQYGETYIYLGAEEELPRVAETLAKVFASEGDEAKSKMMIDKLKEYSAQNDGLLEEDIACIDNEVNALLHPRRFEDDICGKWVLLENISHEGFSSKSLYSPLILEINDVSQGTGANLIEPEQRVPRPKGVTNPLLAYNKRINTSQAIAFDGQNKCVALQFSSLSIKDRRWLTGLSHDLLEQNRDTRAKMKATIVSSNASIEEQLAASAMTALTTATLDVIYKSLNTSLKTENVYNMILFPRTKDVLNAYVSHIAVTTATTENTNPQSRYNEYVKDKRMRFVRWEEEDSMFFVSSNGRPITLREISLDDPLLDEYKQVKRKHSLKNPAYFLPLFGSYTVGAILIINGAEKLRDAHGDEKKNGRSIATICVGGIMCYASTIAVTITMRFRREWAYMDINRRNIEKLRQKAKVSMSISPSYDPSNNSMGANINLSF